MNIALPGYSESLRPSRSVLIPPVVRNDKTEVLKMKKRHRPEYRGLRQVRRSHKLKRKEIKTLRAKAKRK